MIIQTETYRPLECDIANLFVLDELVIHNKLLCFK